MAVGLALAVAVVVGGGALRARGQSGGHQQQAQATGHPEQEVFCAHLSTGQLCTPGTARIPRLDGSKRDPWNEMARRDNEAVAAATRQLLEDAKTTLSPQEFAMVEKWFGHEINEQLNRQVLAAALAGHKP